MRPHRPRLATQEPARLRRMQALFDEEARKHHVYPLINWSDLFPAFMAAQRKMGMPAGSK